MALTPRFQRTPHLVALVAEAERLASLVAMISRPRPARLWEEAILASLRLDGSTITHVPDERLLTATGDELVPGAATPRRGWADTLRSAADVAALSDDAIWAREYAGVRAGLRSDDLADLLRTAPVDALAELHRRMTLGLVSRDDAGRPRRTEQAVHDASVGRVIYFTVAPQDVTSELHRLGGWLASAGAREHGLVRSGVLHYEVLRIHPFEAANGRLARTAARLALRARGLDPHGLAVAELELAKDAVGLYDEVARTRRRRDLTIWLERWGEAVTAGLRTAAHRHGVLDAALPERAERFVHGRDAFTVADYRAEAVAGPEQARSDLAALLDAGRIVRVPGSRGLRFRSA